MPSGRGRLGSEGDLSLKLNADLSRPAAVDSEALAWIDSPIPGVERRMLERDGDEVARATSLVRYAPASVFSPHTHGAGEEFLVLEGVFSDETGDFPAGFYVRNPPGSRHMPFSAAGAVILVKLRQMPPEETASVRLDTRDPALWRDLGPGRREAVLLDAPWERVAMLRLAPGHAGSAETRAARRRILRRRRRSGDGPHPPPFRRMAPAAARRQSGAGEPRRRAALLQDRPSRLMEMHDLIVIGAGLSGLALARAAAQRGAEVVVLERARASAGGS